MSKMKRAMEEWVKERDEAIRSLDVETFKAFYRKWQAKGFYTANLPRDGIIEISLRKSLLMMQSATEEEIEGAKRWLEERGYSAEV